MPAFLRVIVVGSVRVTLSSLKVASTTSIYFLEEENVLLTLAPVSYPSTTWSPSCRTAGSVILTNVSAWSAIALARTRRKIIFFILIGLAALIFGGNLFVDGATALARVAGLSEAVIGITIVSAGSSLPELAVSVNAARKGNVGIALGNVLGSNILNIFLILGCSATITPIALDGFSCVDFYVLLASSLLIYAVTRFGGKAIITRLEGAVLVTAYLAYTAYLIMRA